MTRMLLGPQTRVRCWREIFTEALRLATAFFVHYLKIFRETDGEKRVVVQKLYRWLARTRAIE